MSLLRASHEATVDGVLVVSPDGRIVSYNSRFGAIWPIPDDVIARGSDDEALASVLDKLVDPDAFLDRVRELYAARRPGRDTLRMRDGRVLDRYGTPLVREDGSYLGYAWYVRDVTAERAGEAALTVSEARYRSLVQALSNEVWYATGGGQLLSDMPVWRSITGQSEEELLNGGWLAGIHPDDRPRVAAAWAAAVASRSPYRTEYRIRPVAGTPAEREAGTRTIEVRGVPLERDDGVAEWVGVHVDVTELRSAEGERAALAAAAHARPNAPGRCSGSRRRWPARSRRRTSWPVILEQGEQELQAAASGIALRDGDHVHYHALKGYGADVQDAWRDFAVAVASPVPYVLRTGRPLFLARAPRSWRSSPPSTRSSTRRGSRHSPGCRSGHPRARSGC
jgi:PAS domain S-box-containing protein